MALKLPSRKIEESGLKLPSREAEFFTGKGFGVSERKDPESGRPLLRAPQTIPETFSTPEFQVQLESPDRLATTFDPTVPQKLNREQVSASFRGERLASSASQAIRAELGAGYDEELDHLIALTLSGSNVDENLKIINKQTNRDFGKEESQLARDVIDGKISLVDAQIKMAKKKGVDLPESESNLREKIQNLALKFSPTTLESMAEFQKDPFGVEDTDILRAPEEFLNTITSSVKHAGDSLTDLIGSFRTEERTSKKVGLGLETLARTGGAVLSPISALFAAGEEIPIVKSISKIVSMPFEIAGEGGRLLVERMLDKGILSQLSDEAKEDIKQGGGEVGALVAQLALGKAGHKVGQKTVPSMKAKSFKREVAEEVPELRRGTEDLVSINDVPNKTITDFVKKHGRSKAKEIIKESVEKERNIPKEMKPEEVKVIRQFREDVKVEVPETKAGSERVISIEEVPAEIISDFIKKHGYSGAKSLIKTSLETADGIKKQIESGKTPEQIGNEIKTYIETVEKPPQITKPTPETRTSGVAKSVEARAIEKKLIENIEEKAQFNPTTLKNQAERVAELINNNPERARRIVRGEEVVPGGMSSGAIVQGMQILAERTGNAKIIQELANSPLATKISEAGQELGGARLIERDSAYRDMAELRKFREEKAKKAGAKEGTKERLVNEMKKEQKKVNLTEKEGLSWNKFIDNIAC